MCLSKQTDDSSFHLTELVLAPPGNVVTVQTTGCRVGKDVETLENSENCGYPVLHLL